MSKIEYTQVKRNDIIEVPELKLGGIVTILQNYGEQAYIQLLDITGQIKTGYIDKRHEVFLKVAEDIETQKYRDAYNVFKLNSNHRAATTVGSDPEMFVTDKNGIVIPSFKFLKSSKENDLTYDANKCFSDGHNSISGNQKIFWDGFQAEFNVVGTTCLSWVTDSTRIGLKTLLDKARAYDKDAKLTIEPTLDIPYEMLRDSAPEHVEFGCTPSLNAYNMEGIKLDGRDVPFRSAGGHIHLGMTFDKNLTAVKYVKALDAILGVACVSLFGKYDDAKRRTMYGLAGEYRLPKHGLEYRTLSNVWLSHPLMMQFVFELARRVTGIVKDDLFDLWQTTEEETISCINECNIPLACEILNRNQKIFKAILKSIAYSDEKTTVMYNTFMLGMESLLDNPEDIEANWRLNDIIYGHNSEPGATITRMMELKKAKEVLTVKF